MSSKNVLVTDYVHPDLLMGLDDLGYHSTYAPEMLRKEMEEALPQYIGVVINTRCAIDRQAMKASGQLQWIARLGSGLDIIDLDAAAALGIRVFSAPEGNAQAVAEHAAGMLLCLSNKLISADQSVRNGIWLREQHRGWEISGKTIGIIGFGNNGSAFSRLWKGWNVRVLAYDKYLSGYGNDLVEEISRDELLMQSDIISLHIPLTSETRELVNADFIAKCKKGAILINTSRGKILDLQALLKALRSGHLAGACLDVLAHEPPWQGPDEFQTTFQNICSLENVVLSPHIAGWTTESKQKIANILLDRIRQWTQVRTG
jgi:D-3-phosphoglycerate dehydrogenase